MRKHWMIFACLVLFLMSVARADIVVIVAGNAPVTNTSPTSIRDIFLDRVHTFDNDVAVIPVNNRSLMKYFYLRVADRNQNEMESYWSKLLFTGRGEPPTALEDDSLVIKIIENNPNMIGYVNSTSIKDDTKVKVLETIPEDLYEQ